MANARPYAQINNSMFMNQVNILLERAGHPPMAHGWIDHVAHRTDAQTFRAVFAAQAQGTLKPPSDYGLGL